MLTTPVYDLTPATLRRSHRSSSYDRNGGNIDFRRIPAGGKLTLLESEGPGIVTHLWFALGHMDYNYLRAMVLRIWWDGAEEPSVNCPLGDFFGVGHAMTHRYQSALTSMVRGEGRRGEGTGVNAWFEMPFRRHVRIEVVNESSSPCQACYFMVDWLEVEQEAVASAGYFHALWRRRNPHTATMRSMEDPVSRGRFGANLDGADNYPVVEITGKGRFLGMNLSVDNLASKVLGGNVSAFGEGDEMIFIDDDTWPPSLHGTGTEDYFLDAWGMTGHANLHAGTSLPVEIDKVIRQRGTCYRYHVLDPIYFRERLRFSFEHGQDNCQANDLSSTAYWYQEQPVACPLPVAAERMPRPQPGDPDEAAERRVVVALGQLVDWWYDHFIEGTPEQVSAVAKGTAGTTLRVAGQVRDAFLRGEIGEDEAGARLAPVTEALAAIGPALAGA